MAELTWVTLHGWGSDRRVWQMLMAQLPGLHLHLDLPGFGEAEITPSLLDLDTYLAQCAAQLPANCVLLGWSLGGMIAARLAAAQPDKVRALVTFASNASFVARDGWATAMPADVFDSFCRQFDIAPHKTWKRFCALQGHGDAQPKPVAEFFKSQAPPDASQIPLWRLGLEWLGQLDNRSLLSELRCSQLHFLGRHDALVPVDAAAALAALGGRVEVIEGCAHALPLTAATYLAEVLRNGWFSQEHSAIAKTKIAQSFSAAAATYDAAAHVQRRVAQALLARLPEVGNDAVVLDLGCGTGYLAQNLYRPDTTMVLVDIANTMVATAKHRLPMAQAYVADAEQLPLAPNSFNLVVSSLALQWCSDLQRVGMEVKRILLEDGIFAFTTLGPNTLWELKQSWTAVDGYVHVNAFKTLDQVRDEIERAGFKVALLERFAVVAHYRELITLCRELKAIGAHNMNPGRKQGLTRRGQFRQLEQAYRHNHDEQGQLPATYDVILVIARK